MGLPDASGYCASKGAVTSMTKAAALEVADRNIKINVLHQVSFGHLWLEPDLRVIMILKVFLN